MRTNAGDIDSSGSAQAVWSAIHGAVTIEHAGIGQTPSAASTFERMLDLFVNGLAAKKWRP